MFDDYPIGGGVSVLRPDSAVGVQVEEVLGGQQGISKAEVVAWRL